MKMILQNILNFFIRLIPLKLKGILLRRIFYSLPDGKKNQTRRFFHMVDMEWSFNNLKRKGFYPKMILDIGAYQGGWTKLIKMIFPESEVLMIEAQPKKEKYLMEVKNKYSSTDYLIALLGNDNRGSVNFFHMETGSSVYEEQSNVSRSVMSLPMRTLDSVFIERRSLARASLIKIDVQGFELEVLKGAKEVLKDAEVVLLEAALLNYNKNAPLVSDVIAFMALEGYVLYDICSLFRYATLTGDESDDSLIQMDLIFVKKNSVLRPKFFEFKF